MATTAQLQRPYPPIYHTPQSNSPASVASQPQDQQNRNLYAQSPHMSSHLYGYQPYSPINPVQPSPYSAHPSPQSHPLTSQPLMIPSHQSATSMPSPTTQQPTPPQRTILNPPHPITTTTTSAPIPSPTTPVGTSSTAAPGPIPATTPLVVRQDSNGVQWIAFEYSRDRVKMEYTIRCDVESVNVDNLSRDFKTENCVYPRACCSKDQYKGNRLIYETECNAVGWALAELNPSLRGKRGLIQRAVDSWRNSNQDNKLRSRRVKRMARLNQRQGQAVTPRAAPAHMAAGSPTIPGLPMTPGSRPLPMGPPHLHHHHHHHAHPDGSPHEEVSGMFHRI